MGEIVQTMIRVPWEMSRASVGALSAAMGGEGLLSWRELGEKLRAFELFQGTSAATEEELARSLSLDSWSRLWALEGLGYALGSAGRSLPRAVPAVAAVPLHTGLGLALGVRAVEEVDQGKSPREAVQDFAALCAEAARPGFAGAAFEGLGLAARTLRPGLVPELGRALDNLGSDLAARFWHGLGRALFFVPTNVVPWGSPSGRAMDKAQREPPHDLGRRNVIAGLAWAITLVDLRQPELLDNFLHRHADAPEPDALTHGIVSAVLVWAGASGRDALLDRFLAHRSETPGLWLTRVRRPSEEALATRLPALRRDGRWEDLFRVS